MTKRQRQDMERLREQCLNAASQGSNDFRLNLIPMTGVSWTDLPSGFKKAVYAWRLRMNPDRKSWPQNWGSFRHSFFALPYLSKQRKDKDGNVVTNARIQIGLDLYRTCTVSVTSQGKPYTIGVVMRTNSIVGDDFTAHSALGSGEAAYIKFMQSAALILQHHKITTVSKEKDAWLAFLVNYLWGTHQLKLTNGFATITNLWTESLNAIDHFLSDDHGKPNPEVVVRRGRGRPQTKDERDDEIDRMWGSGDFKGHKDLADELGRKHSEVTRIIRKLQRRKRRNQ